MRSSMIIAFAVGALAAPINQACYKDRATNITVCTDSKSTIVPAVVPVLAAASDVLLNLVRRSADAPTGETHNEAKQLSKEEQDAFIYAIVTAASSLRAPGVISELGKTVAQKQTENGELVPRGLESLQGWSLEVSRFLEFQLATMRGRGGYLSKEEFDAVLVRCNQFVEQFNALTHDGKEKSDAVEVEQGKEKSSAVTVEQGKEKNGTVEVEQGKEKSGTVELEQGKEKSDAVTVEQGKEKCDAGKQGKDFDLHTWEYDTVAKSAGAPNVRLSDTKGQIVERGGKIIPIVDVEKMSDAEKMIDCVNKLFGKGTG